MKVLEKKESPLLNREEYLLSLEFDGATPKKEELKKKFVEFLKVKEDCLIIKKVQQESGRTRVKVKVYVYKGGEDLNKIEEVKKSGERKKKGRNKKGKENKEEQSK